MTRPVLLLSARDPAAGRQIGALAERIASDGRFGMRVVAMEPACSALGGRAECGNLTRIDARRARSSKALIAAAREIVDVVKPAAIIVGLSNPDVGIDEALVAVGGEVPTYAVQDFWGDVNEGLGAVADCFFVRDRLAAVATRAKVKVRTEVTGLPQYDGWQDIDVVARRRQARAAMGLPDYVGIVGLFLQPLWSVPDYETVIEDCVDAAAGLHPAAALYVRAHPKDEEGCARRQRMLERAGALGLAVASAELSIEDAVLACDIVCSAWSTVGCDAAALSRASPEPVNTVLYLTPPAVLDHYRRATDLESFPLVDQGIALAFDGSRPLGACLTAARDAEVRGRIHGRIQAAMPRPGGAAARMLDIVGRDLEIGPRAC